MFMLNIVTPTSQRIIAVSWIELETDHGSLIIQKGHRPLIVSLKALSEIKFQTDQQLVEIMGIVGGIVEVSRNSVIIVVG